MRHLGLGSLWFVMASGLIAVGGCGGGMPAASAPPPVVPSNLVGNWLIAGSLPSLSAPVGTGVNLAMTFDVNGNKVVAAGFVILPCGSVRVSEEFGAVAVGTVAADGTFTAQFPTPTAGSLPSVSVSIQGTVPTASQGSWSGRYTVTNTGFACSGTESGSFTAMPIQEVTGVYAGSLTLTQLVTTGMATQTPVTMQVSLAQGGAFGSPVTGKGEYSEATLKGSIKVQGTTCFASGTVSTAIPSAVEGDRVLADFDMDDGSRMQILGTLEDVGASRVSVQLVQVSGGRCGSMTSFPTTEFVRQG